MRINQQINKNFTTQLANRFDTNLNASVKRFASDEDGDPTISLVADLEKYDRYFIAGQANKIATSTSSQSFNVVTDRGSTSDTFFYSDEVLFVDLIDLLLENVLSNPTTLAIQVVDISRFIQHEVVQEYRKPIIATYPLSFNSGFRTNMPATNDIFPVFRSYNKIKRVLDGGVITNKNQGIQSIRIQFSTSVISVETRVTPVFSVVFRDNKIPDRLKGIEQPYPFF